MRFVCEIGSCSRTFEVRPQYPFQRFCSESHRSKGHRLRNPEAVKRRNEGARARRVALVDAAKARPCSDCGLDEPEIIQLDHVPERGEKLFTISPGRYVGTETLIAEIAKCDPVCPNCHARRGIARGTNQRRRPS